MADFQGNFYDSVIPPTVFFFFNSESCQGFEEFITATILDLVNNGSLLVWGKVGEVRPHYLVMLISVEPCKSRMSRQTFSQKSGLRNSFFVRLHN